jgi:hypothetical protein
MHGVFDSLSKQLEARSPIDVDGTRFTVWLIAIHEYAPQRPDAIQVVVGAKHADESHTGELRINRKRLSEPDFPDIVIETMRRIVSGDLPPGARELL